MLDRIRSADATGREAAVGGLGGCRLREVPSGDEPAAGAVVDGRPEEGITRDGGAVLGRPIEVIEQCRCLAAPLIDEQQGRAGDDESETTDPPGDDIGDLSLSEVDLSCAVPTADDEGETGHKAGETDVACAPEPSNGPPQVDDTHALTLGGRAGGGIRRGHGPRRRLTARTTDGAGERMR